MIILVRGFNTEQVCKGINYGIQQEIIALCQALKDHYARSLGTLKDVSK